MQWMILEALVALALGLLIVVLTLFPARKREREDERRDAGPNERDDDNAD